MSEQQTTSRRVRGVAVVMGVQTGDGRIVADGAIEWADPPLPIAWIVDGDQHVYSARAPVIGNIDSLTVQGNEVRYTGVIDTSEGSIGAQAVAQMEAGTAPNGNRWFVSIDPDNWEVEIVTTREDDDEDVIIVASGQGLQSLVAAVNGVKASLTAAAGDPDPGDEADVLATLSVDDYLERMTRLRIRGLTLCAISAFAEAYIELDDGSSDESSTSTEDEEESAEPEGQTASALRACADCPPSPPPSSWFDQPELEGPTATQMHGDYVFGHLAVWDTCHTGYANECVLAPHSQASYAYFLTGSIECEDGSIRRVGQLTMGCGHAQDGLPAAPAVAHYDGGPGAIQFADVNVGEDEWGIWFAGAIRPNVTGEQRREFRALSPSGDWRRIGGNLELVAALYVPVPGFPIVSLAADGSRTLLPPETPRAFYDDAGVVTSLVAAGRLRPATTDSRLATMEQELGRLSVMMPTLRKLVAKELRKNVVGDLPSGS